MQTADLIFISISSLMVDVYNIVWLMAYCNHLSVKIASENAKDKFVTLHGPLRAYLFEPTTKPGAEWINLIYLCHSVTQKLVPVLGLFAKINFKCFFFMHRHYSDKLTISNYLSLAILHGTLVLSI